MLSIVIPAYNEEKRINNILNEYVKYFDNHSLKYEIIVVCDGTDRTHEIAKEFGAITIRYPHRLGKGKAVRYGLMMCSGDILGFVDADNSITPEDAHKIIKGLKEADCSIASRKMHDSIVVVNERGFIYNLFMCLLSWVMNFMVNRMFMLNIKDTQCGAKFFKRKVYESIRNELELNGWAFDVELLLKIKQHGYKIKETGVVWIYKANSKLSIFNSFGMLKEIIKLKRKCKVGGEEYHS